MQNKFVFIKELKVEVSQKNQRSYRRITDQDNAMWNLWDGMPQVEVNKAYVFAFENENGYNNVKTITPVVNIWKQEALKEVASKSDIAKNISVAMCYSKDLAVGKIIELPQLFEYADKIYGYILQKINTEYDSLNPQTTPKDVT